MKMTNMKKDPAMVKANCASEADLLFHIAKEDMKAILFCMVGIMAALLIRYAIYLPKYMK